MSRDWLSKKRVITNAIRVPSTTDSLTDASKSNVTHQMLSTTCPTDTFRHQIQTWSEICLAAFEHWNHGEIKLEFRVHSNLQLSVHAATAIHFTINKMHCEAIRIDELRIASNCYVKKINLYKTFQAGRSKHYYKMMGKDAFQPVSYTHLTLPTILRV